MRISDHQPTLFGHEGYWSKIAAADVHVVMADVGYRPEDKLTRCTLPGAPSFAAQLETGVENPRIADMRLVRARKLRVSVEQNLMNKSLLFRDRLEPWLPLIEEGQWYTMLWRGMADIVMKHAHISTQLIMSLQKPGEGVTSFSRNLSRLRSCVAEYLVGLEYVCGPAVRNYMTRNEECPMRVLIHEMPAPSPISFVSRIVSEQDPTLFVPALRKLSS